MSRKYLRSQWGTYLTTDGKRVWADADKITISGQWDIATEGSKTTLRSALNKCYLNSMGGPGFEVGAGATGVGDAERWIMTVISTTDDGIETVYFQRLLSSDQLHAKKDGTVHTKPEGKSLWELED